MIKAIIATVFVGVVGVAAYGVGWLNNEWPYLYQNVEVTNTPRPGESLIVHVEVNRTKECSNNFYRELWDGQNTLVDRRQWSQGARPVGPDSYDIAIPLPATAMPGNGRYCFSQEPACNAVQSVLPNWTKMKCYPFTILPPR